MKESPPTLSLSPDIKNTTPQLLLLLKKTLKKTKEKENYTVANVQKNKNKRMMVYHTTLQNQHHLCLIFKMFWFSFHISN